MKCKYCDGTGEHINDANRMTTCEFCGGTGEVEIVGDSVTDVCDKCGGTGFCEMRTGDVCTLGSPCPHQKPLTNEEWLCEQILHFTELSTEEKAKCLAEKIEYLSENLMEVNVNKIAWLRWLKEKHHE